MTAKNTVGRIAALTDDMKATFPDWVRKWTDTGLRTGPLSPQEWEKVEAGVRACYRFAGMPEPVVFHAVSSPFAAAVAQAVAREVTPAAAAHFGVESGVWSGVESGVWSGVESGVWSGVESGVVSGVRGGVVSGVWSGVRGGVESGVRGGVESGVVSGVWSGVRTGVESGVRGGVRGGVESGVVSGVRGGDLLAAYAEWLHEPIRRALANVAPWNAAWSGQYWASWFAWASWFRDVGQLELKGDLWDRFAAQEATAACNYLWWHGPFCIAADRPTALHVENDGGVNRLHCEDGPAVQWADGWGIYAWHGTQVPPDLIEGDGWDVERIAREPNVEVRRCAAERMGWPTFLSTAGVMVGEPADDPGNPGRKLTLYDTRFPLYAEPVRLLHCINASPMADGTHREYVLSVDADHDDPVSAAAAKLSLTRDQYLQFGRAT